MFGALMVLSMVLWAGDKAGASTQGIIAVIAVLVYVFGFAIGLGAVCWVIMSEVIPTRLRTKAVSLFLCINWGCNLVIGLLTLPAIDALGGVKSGMDDDEKSSAEKVGVAILYFIFAIITLIGIVFMQFYVPETKGKTPEELVGDGVNTGIKTNGSHVQYTPLLTSSSLEGTEKSF